MTLNSTGAAQQLIHVEAGMKVRDLCAILDSKNLALNTMGGSDGQSIVGILSTCVHGPDFDRGPVPDMVRAVHLVGPGAVQHWIEPAIGITDPAALRSVLRGGVAIHYDDVLFNAVITSVGTLGLVYSVVLAVQAQYDLVQLVVSQPWEIVREQLSTDELFKPPNRCVQVVVEPVPPHDCFIYTRATAPATRAAPYDITNDPLGLFCTTALADAIICIAGGATAFLGAAAAFIPVLPFPLDVVYGALLTVGTVTALEVAPLVGAIRLLGPGALGDVVGSVLNGDPKLAASAVSFVTASSVPLGTRRGWAHTIMSGPDPGECVARGLALEMAFDATDGSHLSFMDEVLPLLDQWLSDEGLVLSGWFSLRFVGKSRAYLAPENRTDRTCRAELVGLRTMESTAPLLNRIEAVGRKHGSIQHWGMFRNLTREDVVRGYPHLNAWRRARWQLTQQGKLRTFDNEFSIRVGLSDPPSSDISYVVPVLLSDGA